MDPNTGADLRMTHISEQVGTYIGLSSQPLSSRDASMPPTEPACMQKRKRKARLFCHQHLPSLFCPEPVLHRKQTKRRPCLSAPRAIIPSGSSLRDSRNLRKRHSFSQLFLVCFSRACLDKMMHVLYEKWSDEKEFLRNQSDQSSRSSKRT